MPPVTTLHSNCDRACTLPHAPLAHPALGSFAYGSTSRCHCPNPSDGKVRPCRRTFPCSAAAGNSLPGIQKLFVPPSSASLSGAHHRPLQCNASQLNLVAIHAKWSGVAYRRLSRRVSHLFAESLARKRLLRFWRWPRNRRHLPEHDARAAHAVSAHAQGDGGSSQRII